MLKRLLTGVFAVVGASSLAGAAQAATPSHTTTNVNLRAGPGTTYPVLVTVPVGGAITTYGSLEQYRQNAGNARNRGGNASAQNRSRRNR